ncbi:MAG: hypothetical protein ACRDTT_28225, partial [Pseudonocardiaceae bacterium]
MDDLQDVRRLLSLHGLREEPVAELDRRVVRLRGGQLNPIELANLASNLRRQRVRISANYMTPMGGRVKNVASPEKTSGATPPWPEGTEEPGEKTSSPARVVIIDTGVYGDRGDGWLVDLDTGVNREDLDVFPPDDFLDLAAGHGSFCAGIVQQIVPEADIAVYKELDSDGLAHEVRIARTLVRAVRACLKAGQHV